MEDIIDALKECKMNIECICSVGGLSVEDARKLIMATPNMNHIFWDYAEANVDEIYCNLSQKNIETYIYNYLYPGFFDRNEKMKADLLIATNVLDNNTLHDDRKKHYDSICYSLYKNSKKYVIITIEQAYKKTFLEVCSNFFCVRSEKSVENSEIIILEKKKIL